MNDFSKQQDSVSSVLKVFGILQALGDEHEIGVTELSQRVMMSKSTVYRFLQTMKSLGYVQQEGENDKYSLTLKLFDLGAKALQHVDLIRIADQQMRMLSKATQETIHLGAMEDESIVYLHKIDSLYSLRMYSRVGRRNPLYCTAIGKVLLAWLDEQTIRDILAAVTFEAKTANTLADIDALLQELADVRRGGFSEDREEQEMGIRCVAVPVYDRFGHVLAGLSISFPTIRFDENQLAHYVALLHQAAAAISLQLGLSRYPFPAEA